MSHVDRQEQLSMKPQCGVATWGGETAGTGAGGESAGVGAEITLR